MERGFVLPAEGGALPAGYECDYARFFPFWGTLSAQQQKRLANYCKQRVVRAGENLYFHQICNGGMYYVYEGAIRIYIISPSGREATVYHRYRGQTGIIAYLSETPTENIIPVFQAERDTVLAYISRADLSAATQDSRLVEDMYVNVLETCVQEVVNTFYSFAFSPLRTRVARFLLDRSQLSAAAGGDGRFVAVTHELLANETGTSREVATRTLGRMCDEGILRTGRGQVEILDLPRLQELAAH